MTSLNPVFTIGNQLKEAIELHTPRKGKEAMDRAVEMLTLVGVNEPEKRVKQYPYELSGGMRQRVMIAMALACEPDILIADEPTTALDVTIQAQILELMQSLQKKLGMAIIMVTHDLGVIADMCDEIIVMYGGRVCERGTAEDIFYRPSHEYTKGLLKSIPSVDRMGEKLVPIPGTPINLLNMPKGCAFCPRCENAMKICIEEIPPVIADMCDEIIVMYGGRVCERGTAEDIFYRPSHEYTKGLLKSVPSVDRMGEKLVPIPGTPINLLNMPKGCAFCPRCENAMKICIEEIPPEMQMPDGHFASCWMNVKKQMEAQSNE